MAVEDDQTHLGQAVDTTRDIGLDTFNGVPVKAYRLEGSVFNATITKDVLTVKKLLSPISRSECPYIRCIGMNYSEHAKVCAVWIIHLCLANVQRQEIEVDLPSAPSLFIKPRTSLADPFPAPLSIPKIAQDGSSDYEAELCVVIGREGRNIPKDKALEYVLGYTASNDVSSRNLQMASQQWSFSKGLDSACPIGRS